MIIRKPWEEFVGKRSETFVRGLVSGADFVPKSDLLGFSALNSVMPDADFPKESSDLLGKSSDVASSGKKILDASLRWHDKKKSSITICLAYAQDELIYNSQNQIIAVDAETYAKTSRAERVNKFGMAYKRGAKFLLHKTLADIVLGAADYLYETYGWRTVLYDGLRTVEGAFALYNFASDEDLASNILALPAKSAHNKGLAVDSMMVDAEGREIEMGGHFDHLDMATNMRNYAGDKISEIAKKNRLIREAAFLRSAFAQGLLIAPLRSEFWDDRLPENREDLWRVLDSTARVVGVLPVLSNKENWDYADFLENWQKTFAGHEEKLEKIIGCTMPPLAEKPEFYHGNYNPIYDDDLE